MMCRLIVFVGIISQSYGVSPAIMRSHNGTSHTP